MHQPHRRDRLDRRGFLKGIAGMGIGAALLPYAGCAMAQAAGAPERRIGVQLYTVRDRLARDFEATLRQVAALGYKEVEFAGYYDRTPQQVRALLDATGLSAPSTHLGVQAFRDNLGQVLTTARAVGHHWLVVPWLAEAERTVEGYQRLAAELNRYGAAAREQGMKMGYHNHDFEFAALPGGRTGMDILLADTDPALVDIELDLFWTVKAGHDPVAIFERHPGRFPMWHVKDMADIKGAQRMVEVGAGEIDFGRIFAHAERSGMRHFFVEHDEPADSLESIRTSYQNLSRVLS